MSEVKDFLENEIYPSLDRAEALADLEPQDKGDYYSLICPDCKKREAYIYKNGIRLFCNRQDKCGFSQSLWDYVQNTKGLTSQETLRELARLANYTLPELDQGSIERGEREREKAETWETAIGYFKTQLWAEGGKEVLSYLKERGYTEQEIKAMELGYLPSQTELEDYLINKGYQETLVSLVIKSLSHIRESYKLAIAYRDPVGRAKGVIVRALKKDIKKKYLYNKGLSLDSPFNLDMTRGARKLIVVEGFLDALSLREKGIKNIIALGGSSFSETKIDQAVKYGTRAFILTLDNDQAGQDGTDKAIGLINKKDLKAYVATLPEGYDPDRLAREKGKEALEELLRTAQSGVKWKATRLIEKHKDHLNTDIGREKAIEEAIDYAGGLSDPLDYQGFYETLAGPLKLPPEVLAFKIQNYKEKKARDQVEKGYHEFFREGSRLLQEDKLEELREYSEKKIRELKAKAVSRAIEPYSLRLLIEDINQTRPGLKTGYESLDKFLSIPQEAITIIGARPSHGKTTLLMNLLLKFTKKYQDKSFFYFSYEESRRQIGIKLLNILSGTIINSGREDENVLMLEDYLRDEKTDSEEIERGKKVFNELIDSKRLWVIDEPYFVDELGDTLAYLAERHDTGAVFVDYIQKVKIKGRYQTRQIELQKVSERILETAKSLSIPIILGAQFGRDKEHKDKVRLDNLREAGDIEQDANLVLGLYNPAMEKAQEEGEFLRDATVDLKITILKNRNGPVNEEATLSFNRPLLTIEEKAGVRDKF